MFPGLRVLAAEGLCSVPSTQAVHSPQLQRIQCLLLSSKGNDTYLAHRHTGIDDDDDDGDERKEESEGKIEKQ